MKDAVGFIKKDDLTIVVTGALGDEGIEALKKAAKDIGADEASASFDPPATIGKRVSVYELSPKRDFSKPPEGLKPEGEPPGNAASKAHAGVTSFFKDNAPPTPVRGKVETPPVPTSTSYEKLLG